MYGDLTGKFTNKPSRGNYYLMVVYDYDTSVVWVSAIKSRQAAKLIAALNTFGNMFIMIGHE